MNISEPQKQNPYNKPNPFRVPVKFKLSTTSIPNYEQDHYPSSQSFTIKKQIDYWKFNENHNRSNSYLPHSQRQHANNIENSNPFKRRDSLFCSGASLKIKNEPSVVGKRYRNEVEVVNPFYRKNLVIQQSNVSEQQNSQFMYNKYFVDEFALGPQLKPFVPSSKINYDSSSRPSQSRKFKESQINNNQSMSYSLVMNLLDKKQSSMSSGKKLELIPGSSHKSPRLSPKEQISHQKSYPKQITRKGHKFHLKSIYKSS